MKLTGMVILGGALLGYGVDAQAQASAQANSSANSSTSARVNRSGAQASSNSGASASANSGENSASLANGTAMNATLSQPVDAKKNKAGDPVAAKTTEPVKFGKKVVIPRGSKLVGHVTQAKARSKGESESALGIVFDKAILKNGREIPLNVAIQALAAGQTAASSSMGDDDFSAGAGAVGGASATAGGMLGGMASTAGGAAGAVTNTAANAGGAVNSTANAAGAAHCAIGGLNAAGQLASNSQGVFGLNGLNLNSAASNSTEGSLITSTSRNVHLASGTQLLLVSQGQAPAGSAKQ